MHTQAPGKLVLFGEYAVLEGHTALVASVNRYARCRIQTHPHFELEAGHFGTFEAAQLSEPFGEWQVRQEQKIRVNLLGVTPYRNPPN